MGITLVTGAAGFIGSHLTEALVKSGRTVRAFVQPDSWHLEFVKGLGVEVVYGDLFDKESLARALEGVDEVYHLAASVRPAGWFYSRSGLLAEMNRVNCEGTRNLAEAARGRVKLFVYYSSIAAAGVRPSMDETCDALPETEYGWSKYNGEKYLLELHKAEGFPVKVVRPGSVFGPRHLNMALIFKFLRFSFFPFFGPGNNTVPFTYVENLIDATLLVADKAPFGEVYFVTEEPVSMRAFFGGIAAAAGRRLSGFYVPLWLLYPGFLLKEAVEGLFRFRFFPLRMDLRLDSVRVASGDWVCSSGKVRKLGWRPRFTLAEAFEKTGRWYKEQGLA
ncbi:MAG: NAD-dependent epimerase/dehydratase family protein [Elusimicrobiales bacterium]|nr:NAD-dependent epimerase/dehydratase family protein [Elusimicrobiales bacterium]